MLAKIMSMNDEGLQMIAACRSVAEVKISNSKYLQENKVFLLYLKRSRIEIENEERKVNSVCKFEFVDGVKSKNIKQNNDKQSLKLIAIDFLKKNKNYEINLIFKNNAYITLLTEIIEVTLEDQTEIN